MTDQPHTPTTDEVERAFRIFGRTNGPISQLERQAEFFRWLTAHEEEIRKEEREDIVAAEQRGAERGWDQAIHHISLVKSDPSFQKFYLENPYRADQIEVDDEYSTEG